MNFNLIYMPKVAENDGKRTVTQLVGEREDGEVFQIPIVEFNEQVPPEAAKIMATDFQNALLTLHCMKDGVTFEPNKLTKIDDKYWKR